MGKVTTDRGNTFSLTIEIDESDGTQHLMWSSYLGGGEPLDCGGFPLDTEESAISQVRQLIKSLG